MVQKLRIPADTINEHVEVCHEILHGAKGICWHLAHTAKERKQAAQNITWLLRSCVA